MNAKIALSVAPERAQVKAGEQVAATVTIRNRSDDVEHYRLSLEGLPAGWADIAPEQVAAFPLQETQAQLVVHPPADAAGASYTLTVRAASQLRPDVTDAIGLDVSVPVRRPVPALPPEARGPAVAPAQRIFSQVVEVTALADREVKLPPGLFRWRVTVRNGGRTLEAFGFCLRNVPAVWLSIDPPHLTLTPSESATAVLTVAIASSAPPGAYAFPLYAYLHGNTREGTELPLACDVPAGGAALAMPPDAPVRAVSTGAAQIELRADHGRIAVAAGERASLPVTLINRAGARVESELAVEGVPHTWVALERPSVSLLMGDSVEQNVRVAPPGDAPPGVYPLSIRVGGRADPAQSVHLDLMLDVTASSRSAVSRLMLSVEPKRLSVSPGATGECALTLQNLSTTVDQATIGVEGIPPDWTQAIPPVVPVFAQGQKATTRLTIQPPRDAALALAGDYAMRVTATSQEQAGLVVREPIELNVPFSGDYELRLQAPAAAPANEASYGLTVVNRANAPLGARLSATDAEGRLTFKFSPLNVDVPAGGSAAVTVTVRPKAAPREPRTTAFELAAQGEYRLAGNKIVPAAAHNVGSEYAEIPPAPEPPPLPPPATLRLTIEPAQLTDAEFARYAVQVQNLTAGTVAVRLTVSVDAQALEARIAAPTLTLAPMAAGVASMTVEARTRFEASEQRVHRIEVAARTDNEAANSTTAHAVFVQIGVPAGDRNRTLTAFAAVAIVALVIWVVLPRMSLGGAAPRDTIDLVSVRPQAPFRRTEVTEVIVRYGYFLANRDSADVRVDFVIFDDDHCSVERSAGTAAIQTVRRGSGEAEIVTVWNRFRSVPTGNSVSVRLNMTPSAQTIDRSFCFPIMP